MYILHVHHLIIIFYIIWSSKYIVLRPYGMCILFDTFQLFLQFFTWLSHDLHVHTLDWCQAHDISITDLPQEIQSLFSKDTSSLPNPQTNLCSQVHTSLIRDWGGGWGIVCLCLSVSVCVSVCLCLCVWERKREVGGKHVYVSSLLFTSDICVKLSWQFRHEWR